MAAEHEKISNDMKNAQHREDAQHRKEEKAAYRAAKREKSKAYYAANKEKAKAYRETYRANNREKIREKDRARYVRNRERILRRSAELRGPPKPKKPPKFKYQAAFNKRVREEKRYYCEACDTACSKPNELKRHFETKKHARNSQGPERLRLEIQNPLVWNFLKISRCHCRQN